MSYWKQIVKNFFITSDSGPLSCNTEIDALGKVAIHFGNSFTIRLSTKDAVALRDAISISVIKIQDGLNYSIDTSRVTNGDMGQFTISKLCLIF